MMRNILVLSVILMVSFLACLPVPGRLIEPDSPDSPDSPDEGDNTINNTFDSIQQANGITASGNMSLDSAKEMLKNMTAQSEEMLNQSQKEYMEAKTETEMNSSVLGDFEATLSVIEQLIIFLTGLIDSAVTIIDYVTAFSKKISLWMIVVSNLK